MNTLLANLLQTLNELAEHGRVFFDALSLDAPGAVSAVAVLALCATAAVVVLDASRRTLAVPTWSYLRRDVAQLAAERDGKRGLVDSLRAECAALQSQLERLQADKLHLAGITERRQAEEAALRDVLERLARMEDDRAFIDAIRAELDTLKSERGALQQQIAALQAERAEFESDLTGRRAYEARLQGEISDLKSAREATGAHVNQMKLELETLLRQVEAARTSLREAEQKSGQEGAALDALERECERLNGEAGAVHGRGAPLEQAREGLWGTTSTPQGGPGGVPLVKSRPEGG